MQARPAPSEGEARSSCVVLVSGGLDSAACIDYYLRQDFAVRGLHVDYGQDPAANEARAARGVANHYRIPLNTVTLAMARPKSIGEVPGRNAFFVLTALMETSPSRALIALGSHAGTAYYDCSGHFLTAVQTLLDGYCDGQVRVAAPFAEWTKAEVFQYCISNAVPIDLTHSCERGLDHPCGQCLSCKDREALSVSKNLSY